MTLVLKSIKGSSQATINSNQFKSSLEFRKVLEKVTLTIQLSLNRTWDGMEQ